MRRLILLALILSACFPLQAQGNLGGEAEGTTFPSLFGLPTINLGKIVVNPYVQAGYQSVGCNMSFPIQFERVVAQDNRLQIGTMELWLRDANFWTGTVGVNAVVNPTISLFGSAGGFVPRSIIGPSVLPVSLGGATSAPQIDFTGTNVEFWVLQAGASVTIGGGWSVLGGWLWDHFGMDAIDPRIGDRPFPDQTLRADFLTKTSVPFIGLQLSSTQLKYRASVLYSPLAQCRVILANRSSSGALTELLYTFNKPGQFLLVNGEYDVEFSKTTYFSLWAIGLWMNFTGAGNLEYKSTFPVIDVQKRESDAFVGKYSVAGGIGLGLVF